MVMGGPRAKFWKLPWRLWQFFGWMFVTKLRSSWSFKRSIFVSPPENTLHTRHSYFTIDHICLGRWSSLKSVSHTCVIQKAAPISILSLLNPEPFDPNIPLVRPIPWLTRWHTPELDCTRVVSAFQTFPRHVTRCTCTNAALVPAHVTLSRLRDWLLPGHVTLSRSRDWLLLTWLPPDN